MKDYDHYIRQVFRSSQENYFTLSRKIFFSSSSRASFRVICYAWFLELSIWCLESVECDGWKECAHFRILHTFQQSKEHFIYIKIVECHLSMNFQVSFFTSLFLPFYLCVVVVAVVVAAAVLRRLSIHILYMLYIAQRKKSEQQE